ncbi:hypothetical protein BGX29_006223 [Mortierella sp. GBA35]|nr:hypothetical protein BGX29_006223 [Mortierella sp. GBA35]
MINPYDSLGRELTVKQGPFYEHADAILDYIRALPQQHIENLTLFTIWEQFPGQISTSLHSHAMTLESIFFTEAMRVSSASLRGILTTCQNLETFEMGVAPEGTDSDINFVNENPAFICVFDIAELRDALAQYVERRNLMSLSQTNRSTHESSTTLVWRNLNLTRSNVDHLLSSSDWIDTWNTNRNLTRRLAVPPDFAWALFAATIGNLQDTAPWITFPHPEGFTQVPLLMGTDLRSFQWTAIANSQRTEYHPVVLTNSQISVHWAATPIQTPIPGYIPASWISHNNLSLKTIAMNIFHCSDHVHARTFIRVISTLPQLRKLSLFSLGNNISASFIMKFFKCLPPSLELLQLRHYISDDVGDLAELAVEGDADFGIEPLAERPGPLTNLTDLSLPSHDESYTVEQIESILQHCPSLTKLVIPQHLPLTVGAGGRFIEMIQDHCPLVRGWTILQPNGTNPEDRETLLEVLDTLPLNQVESLAWREYTEQVAGDEIIWHFPFVISVLPRFSNTLRNLQFFKTQQIPSNAIREILTTYAGLKSFSIREATGRSNFLTLEDAIKTPWVRTGLGLLEIAVAVPDPLPLSFPIRGEAKWASWGLCPADRALNRASVALPLVPHSWTGRSQHEFDTVLAEGATADTDPAAVVIVNASIDINRGGFLSLLGGLTHLEELRGSIHLATRNFSNVFSNVEVDWIQSHWPRLRFVEFYMQATMDQANLARDIPEPVLRLKNEMHV